MEKYRHFLEECYKQGSAFTGEYRKQGNEEAHILVNSLGEIVIPGDDVLDSMDVKDLQEIYHR